MGNTTDWCCNACTSTSSYRLSIYLHGLQSVIRWISSICTMQEWQLWIAQFNVPMARCVEAGMITCVGSTQWLLSDFHAGCNERSYIVWLGCTPNSEQGFCSSHLHCRVLCCINIVALKGACEWSLEALVMANWRHRDVRAGVGGQHEWIACCMNEGIEGRLISFIWVLGYDQWSRSPTGWCTSFVPS